MSSWSISTFAMSCGTDRVKYPPHGDIKAFIGFEVVRRDQFTKHILFITN